MLLLQGAPVGSLLGEIRSHMPRGAGAGVISESNYVWGTFKRILHILTDLMPIKVYGVGMVSFILRM